jgi:putative Ca2+/H+ antiporter (TMEM165/GDT1 family)
MSFATRYSAYKVIFAVFIATIANHALAVVAGQFLTTIVPMDIISLATSLSFIGFGLWSNKGDKLKAEDKKTFKVWGSCNGCYRVFYCRVRRQNPVSNNKFSRRIPKCSKRFDGNHFRYVGIVVGVVLCKRIPEQ